MLATVLCAQYPITLAFDVLNFVGCVPHATPLIAVSFYSPSATLWEGYIVPATNFLLLELQVVSTNSQLRVWSRPGKLTWSVEWWPFCRTLEGRV
jgi:hypothetical protein